MRNFKDRRIVGQLNVGLCLVTCMCFCVVRREYKVLLWQVRYRFVQWTNR